MAEFLCFIFKKLYMIIGLSTHYLKKYTLKSVINKIRIQKYDQLNRAMYIFSIMEAS